MLVETGDDDNDAPVPHWNPQLVAQLEAERAQGLPKRKPPNLDPPEAIARRRQVALEMMRRRS